MSVRRADDVAYTLASNISALAAPTQNAPSTSTTGGTLAAATYYYKVSALNAQGETLPSNEQSQITTGTTSSNTINWTAVTGATSYRIYRGTSTGAQNVYYTSAAGTTSFLDTGAAATSGTVATVNMTGSGADVNIKGGEYMFTAEGTVGGSTISLQIKTSNGTYVDISIYAGSAVKTTALPFSQTGIDLPACTVRMAATAGAAASMYSYLIGLG